MGQVGEEPPERFGETGFEGRAAVCLEKGANPLRGLGRDILDAHERVDVKAKGPLRR